MSFESAKNCRLIAIHRNDNRALNRDRIADSFPIISAIFTIDRDFIQDLTDCLLILSTISLILLEAHVWIFSLICSILFILKIQADQIVLSLRSGAGPILIRPLQCSPLQIMDQNWHFLDSKYSQEIICQKSIFRRLTYYTLTDIVCIYVCVHNKTVDE